jgi:transmembrane sensor
MDTEKIIALIEGYGAGTLTPGEETAFLQWYSAASLEEFHTLLAQCQHLPSQLVLYPDIPAELQARLEQDIRKIAAVEDSVFAEGSRDIGAAEQAVTERSAHRRKIRLLRSWWAAAAAIILLLAGGWYFQVHRRHDTQLATTQKGIGGDVAPGTTRAVLTLADGTRITLDSAKNGQLAMQGKTTISHQNGVITYNGKTAGELLYNTLTTAAGEQSPPLTLSDGTRVWLNAASSIRYPVDFAGDTRTVTVTGEAYFEVAKDAAKPFYVQARDLTVAVLGTDFNINAYADEPAIRTTLLAGSVKVLLPGADRLLLPGQQDQMMEGANPAATVDRVTTVDIDQVMAWKNGLFNFNHADLPTVLRQLARWYAIDVRFEGEAPARTFHGKMTRDLNLSQVVAVLQDVGVKFRLEGRTLIVEEGEH